MGEQVLYRQWIQRFEARKARPCLFTEWIGFLTGKSNDQMILHHMIHCIALDVLDGLRHGNPFHGGLPSQLLDLEPLLLKCCIHLETEKMFSRQKIIQLSEYYMRLSHRFPH